MEKLPEEYKDYQYIADMFSRIKGVEMILLTTQDNGEEVSLLMTNNRTGLEKKVFTVPLKTTLYIDYHAAPANCPNNYDINTYPDPSLILNGALAKARMLFEDIRMN